jgi:hypothetical protein
VGARHRWGLGPSGLFGGVLRGAEFARWGLEGVAAQDRGEHRGQVLRPVHPFPRDPDRQVGGGPATHQWLGGAFEPSLAELVDASPLIGA